MKQAKTKRPTDLDAIAEDIIEIMGDVAELESKLSLLLDSKHPLCFETCGSWDDFRPHVEEISRLVGREIYNLMLFKKALSIG